MAVEPAARRRRRLGRCAGAPAALGPPEDRHSRRSAAASRWSRFFWLTFSARTTRRTPIRAPISRHAGMPFTAPRADPQPVPAPAPAPGSMPFAARAPCRHRIRQQRPPMPPRCANLLYSGNSALPGAGASRMAGAASGPSRRRGCPLAGSEAFRSRRAGTGDRDPAPDR